ncbi:N-acetylmuramoyl-L-alanine amidase [Paenibacillus sp. N4]|uniref:N-acetylmuramoyl-L-alanine amidase n=1 Tax=Paenibacillus vietnamensis TaxID=2590547 RepID=UPI001CD0C32D|nr:N-acetylmuramoyl-L-alanine amidase [Paenibacillus vietnamensis]MCA0754893.1 N-acetylmuramoyl-L-alanine amidase [Paenibacillus vietnamensis]
MTSLIRTKVNGFVVTYAVIDPAAETVYAAHQNGATVKELGQREMAAIALNFNYADTSRGIPIGRLIIDSNTFISDITKTAARDELYMMPDRTLHIGKAPAGALWAIQGSPPLLKDGNNVITEGIKRDQLGTDIWRGGNYRTASGITAAGKLVIVRTYDKVTMDDLADIMAKLGCVDALNGDGGGSSYLWPADDGWGRTLGSALIVKKGVATMEKPYLIIDPGHGGKDPGAAGNGIIEKEYTLKISLYMYERFKALSVPVALTRDVDKTIESSDRGALVKASGAKYCISNHINAAPSSEACGAEVIHSIHNDGKLAHAIVGALQDAGQKLRPKPVFSKANEATGSDYYFMHRLTGSVTTLIVEYGFCSNATDAACIKENWKAYAEAVIRAFCSFTGYAYTPPALEVTKPVEPPVKPLSTPVKSELFSDVPADNWAIKSIEKAAKAGIINGVAPGEFGLGQPVTREQLAVILDRLGFLRE